MSRGHGQLIAVAWMLAPLWAYFACLGLQLIADCRQAADSGFCHRFGGETLGSFATLLWYFAIVGWVVTVPTGLIAVLLLALRRKDR